MKTAGSVGPSVERFQSCINIPYGPVLAGVHPDAHRPIVSVMYVAPAAQLWRMLQQFSPLTRDLAMSFFSHILAPAGLQSAQVFGRR